jgi:CBS domain-containing protein
MNATIGTLLEFKGSHIYSVPPTTPVMEAVLEMNRHNIGSIAVIEGSRLVGMFTARDVMHKVVPAQLDARITPVSQVMHSDYPALTKEMTIDDAMELFDTHNFRHLPIVEAGRIIGILSIGDLSRWCATANRAEAESLKNYIHTGMIT